MDDETSELDLELLGQLALAFGPEALASIGGIGAQAQAFARMFLANPKARLVAEIAEATGISYTSLLEMSDEDLAALIGLKMARATEAAERCPQCGLDHSSFWDDDRGTWLSHPSHGIKVSVCGPSAEVLRVRKTLEAQLGGSLSDHALTLGLVPIGELDNFRPGQKPIDATVISNP